MVTAVAIVRIGGDFMHARLLLPSLFAGVAPVATVAVRRGTVLALVAVPWAVVCLVGLRPREFTPDQIAGIADHRGELQMLTGVDHVVTLDDYGYGPDGPHRFAFDDEHRLYYGRTPVEVDGAPPALVAGAPERVLLAYGVGAIGYFAGPDTHVVDMLGLGDSLAARLELRDRGPLPGHEKALPAAWVWARYVDPAVRPEPGLIVAAGVIGACRRRWPRGRAGTSTRRSRPPGRRSGAASWTTSSGRRGAPSRSAGWSTTWSSRSRRSMPASRPGRRRPSARSADQ